MGRYESNAGNDKVTGGYEVWVGQEECPANVALHVATGPAELFCDADFAALRALAKDSNTTLLAFWNALTAASATWPARVATKAGAAGFTQGQWRQMARDAFAA
jgi:hypothetical protein